MHTSGSLIVVEAIAHPRPLRVVAPCVHMRDACSGRLGVKQGVSNTRWDRLR